MCFALVKNCLIQVCSDPNCIAIFQLPGPKKEDEARGFNPGPANEVIPVYPAEEAYLPVVFAGDTTPPPQGDPVYWNQIKSLRNARIWFNYTEERDSTDFWFRLDL